MIVIDVRGAISKCAKADPLTHGMVGQQAKFQFDHVWKNLAVQAFAASGEKSYPLVIRLDNTVVIPHELMKEGNIVLLGVRGLNDDGTVRIPTTWASIGVVQASVDGKNEYQPQPDPTPSEIEQLLILSDEVRRIAQSVRDDADAGKFNGEKGEKGDPGAVDPAAVSAAVSEYLEKHPFPTKISAFQNDSGYALKSEIPAPYNDSELRRLIGGKQDTISDLATIRSGADAGAKAYAKPADGIPETDLSEPVRTKLNSGGSLPADAFITKRVSCQSVEELFGLVPDSDGAEEQIYVSLFIVDGFDFVFYYDEGHGLDQYLFGHCVAVRYGDAINMAAYDIGQSIIFELATDEPDGYVCTDMVALDGFGILESSEVFDILDNHEERISDLEEGGGGSGSGFFIVNLTNDSPNGGHADKTLEEVVDAFQSGLIPIAKTAYKVYQFVNYHWGQGMTMARFADNSAETIVMLGNDDGTAWEYDPLLYMELENTPIGEFVNKKLAELDGSGVYY